MRVLLPVVSCAALLIVSACGDEPKSKGASGAAATRIDAGEARLIGLHEQALSQRAQGKYVEALRSFDELIVLAPEDLRVHFNRAVVLAELGRNAEALAIYDDLLRKTPNDPQLFQNRAAVLNALGRSEEALIELDSAMQGLADSPVLRVLRGSVLVKLARNEEALAELDRADQQLAAQPPEALRSKLAAEALLYRGEALEALGRGAEAAPIFERLRTQFQGNAAAEALLRERGRL
jgi:tetratricopeptide (TPR) repeat protein